MLRRLYTLLTASVVILLITAVSGVHNAERDVCIADVPQEEGVTVTVASDITATEGIISEAPQVPQTIPVRRVMSPTSSGGMSLSRIVRPCYNLSLKQLATDMDILLNSLTNKGGDAFAGALSPYNCTRSCEYYVFALRSIII